MSFSESLGGVLRKPRGVGDLRFLRGDATLVGFLKREGWKGELPVYRWRCPVHGLVEDYPHGFDSVLRCPKCEKLIVS